VAIPVPLSKIFRHSCIYIRTGAGIERPQDLAGRRIGTSQYSSTGLTFLRGMLEHDYGVRSQDMRWYMGGMNTFREKPLIALDLPKEIQLEFLPDGDTLEAKFARGELDALLSLYIPEMFLNGDPRIARLFPDFKSVEQEYYKRTHIHPSCIRWCCARMFIAITRGRRAQFTTLSARRARKRWRAFTTRTR